VREALKAAGGRSSAPGPEYTDRDTCETHLMLEIWTGPAIRRPLARTIVAALFVAASLSTVVVPCATSALQRDRRDGAFSFVLRAGRNYQTLGNLELRRRKSSVSLADAIDAFGRPSSCRAGSYSGTALARWHSSGSRWETSLGLQVGSTVDDLKSVYPHAIFRRRPLGVLWPAPAYWIVHVRERCVVGICNSRYQTVPRLAAHVKSGAVVEFYFPAGAQGE
jgi:hypothetical protein